MYICMYIYIYIYISIDDSINSGTGTLHFRTYATPKLDLWPDGFQDVPGFSLATPRPLVLMMKISSPMIWTPDQAALLQPKALWRATMPGRSKPINGCTSADFFQNVRQMTSNESTSQIWAGKIWCWDHFMKPDHVSTVYHILHGFFHILPTFCLATISITTSSSWPF